ncbi:DUF4846 domain-containing protein [Fulvivirgaceae bacterium BMA10]|uniref:DUF4846 domain-containing protein n=1 Tax=Splendidivirga corallicola TaxID=3051826 RepID=A0ABT8KS24_9BACT|nr:DUF4846 domain-containing protein [Fulvivirgaceae bacterium BMA10]
MKLKLFSIALLVSFVGCKQISDKQESHNEITIQQTSSFSDTLNQLKKITDIKVPSGYARQEAIAGSFMEYLRNLPIKDDRIVTLYNGLPKFNQLAHFAILDIDVGDRDLQQCADAVMRLRAEYLFHNKYFDKIHFNFTSGHKASYTQYAKGYRPKINGNQVVWKLSAGEDHSYKNFRKYMDLVFSYAGSYSLDKELKRVSETCDIKPGDVFIQGGFPGHAVIVVDIAKHEKSNKKIFMLAQSYMPAQEIHILKNPKNKELSPWYPCDFQGELKTPEWTFKKSDLKRW